MADDLLWHCQQLPNGANPIVVCEREGLLAEIERLRAALALAVGELSTYGPMRYTSPEQLMQHFLEEARRG